MGPVSSCHTLWHSVPSLASGTSSCLPFSNPRNRGVAALPDGKAQWRPLTSPQYLAKTACCCFLARPGPSLSLSSMRMHQARHTGGCELTCGSQDRGWPHPHAGQAAVLLPAPGVCAPAEYCCDASRLLHLLIFHAQHEHALLMCLVPLLTYQTAHAPPPGQAKRPCLLHGCAVLPPALVPPCRTAWL